MNGEQTDVKLSVARAFDELRIPYVLSVSPGF